LSERGKVREDDAVSERPTLFDALVDLAVYAPVGLALTAAEELPDLIAKGRSRIEPQLGTARLVGQFAVAEGRRRVIRFSGLGGVGVRPRPTDRATGAEEDGHTPPDASPASTSGGTPESSEATGSSETTGSSGTTGESGGGTKEAASTARARKRTAASSATGSTVEVPEVESLAIPGYDSLSASQVVQRLAGLSPSELSAVGRYEAATRGRRTILARVSQLQGD
jgi:hypothetical protein